MESEKYSNMKSEMISNMKSEVKSKLESEEYSNMYSNMKSEMISNMKSEVKSKLESEEYSNMKSEMISKMISNRKSEGKVEAIRAAPKPENKQQLQAFLGLVNFYHSFLPNKASIAEPLHGLLDGDAPWNWSSDHTKAFNSLKQLISSESVLTPFDDSLPIVLTCDASPYGVGAVLAHVLPDGREAPVAFHSRTLTSTERNYAQLDKEALAIISGVKKFYHFLYGHHLQ
ncbi:hypothetical protein JTE90_009750 [Oedothorax gibbosus]|uniref:Reverse transcriptase/retrotransposon-derived protein RNase H-like domain-containing protein n=1 Tax=Oedothorax gibbosus TaxID=931172 RepID=A0AAV6V8B1_9ARAC|nr:hypothetical protein JTE90_009750 [Oedothorax gibbosus]